MTGKQLEQLAHKLRQQNIDAEIGTPSVHPKSGPQLGLSVAGVFYPLWELNEEGNEPFIEAMDFDSIRKKRKAGWTLAKPPGEN